MSPPSEPAPRLALSSEVGLLPPGVMPASLHKHRELSTRSQLLGPCASVAVVAQLCPRTNTTPIRATVPTLPCPAQPMEQSELLLYSKHGALHTQIFPQGNETKRK